MKVLSDRWSRRWGAPGRTRGAHSIAIFSRGASVCLVMRARQGADRYLMGAAGGRRQCLSDKEEVHDLC
ncbi:MAG TPA: hypothetical protein VGD25_07035, partial [Immundisolibacter sp.]